MSSREQILVVGPSWVGDMVMAQTLFMVLKKQGDCDIDVIAPAWSEAILARMPEVRASHILNVGHGELRLGARLALGRQLQSKQYDRAIVLPRSLKSALVPFFAGARKRTGFRGEMRYGLLNDVRTLDKERLNQTVKRFAALGLEADAPLTDLPYPMLNKNPDNQARLAADHNLATDQSAVALMPGAAYGPAKMWPLDHFAELAVKLASDGRQVWVLGGKAEMSLGESIADNGGSLVRNLCGVTRLEDTVDLLALAGTAVSNDSGLLHVAAAAGTHVVGLYGSTPPEFAPPLTKTKTVHYLNLDCSPCKARECPLGHLNCLRNIRPDDVLASIMAT